MRPISAGQAIVSTISKTTHCRRQACKKVDKRIRNHSFYLIKFMSYILKYPEPSTTIEKF
jgi:hypothetical protein